MAETWLTQEAYDRLQAELAELKTQGRSSITAAIEEARAHGDLKENAEYHSAKEEQGRMEARIRQLEELLRDARIGETPPADEVAAGLIVTLLVEGDEETYFVGSREDSHDEYEVLSTSSPIGKAVLGAKPGDSVKAETPGGGLDITVKDLRRP
ncbi:MAG: transcription elongation factor GreA [Actinobacteria bacterium]|nr:transcription elongation factor GreA [Actinomycetota bacterium]